MGIVLIIFGLLLNRGEQKNAALCLLMIPGIVIMIGIYIILCASLNLVNGFSGMFSMGHAAFMAIGAYMAAFFTLAPQVKENQCPGLPGAGFPE